jgi:DNA-binding PadR family transcriptional regulator
MPPFVLRISDGRAVFTASASATGGSQVIIDDERRHNLFGPLMSLDMLIETPGGFDYTGAVRLGDDAYGATIRREIEARAGRHVSIGAAYATLDRLVETGYLRAREEAGGADRGGRVRRFFTVTPSGIAALETRAPADAHGPASSCAAHRGNHDAAGNRSPLLLVLLPAPDRDAIVGDPDEFRRLQ